MDYTKIKLTKGVEYASIQTAIRVRMLEVQKRSQVLPIISQSWRKISISNLGNFSKK